MTERQLFQKNVAPTSLESLAFPIRSAKGAMLYDTDNKQYIDLISGISVCNVGHCHPHVVSAIQKQAEEYAHVMVYGEVVQSPQVQYAGLLAAHLPESLDCVYFTNSGAEAVEGAMKLAKRLTNRTEIIACHNSYHGSTQGALSLLGDEYWRNAYRPLLPGIRHVRYNDFESIQEVTEATAAIFIEPIQAEAGVIVPEIRWMRELRNRCDDTGTLLVFDEIQTGMGRTGKLWAFEHYGIAPDILLLAKALGGGMPLGAFISSNARMKALADKPILGHITTFGGHPVSCAAGKAALEVILNERLLESVQGKGQLFAEWLQHDRIKEVRMKGLMIAVELEDFEAVQEVISKVLKAKPVGLFVDWFLFASNCVRIVPPLNISENEIRQACEIFKAAL